MPSTPNFAIPYPAGTDNFSPLQNWIAGVALGADSALTTGLGGAPRVANSDAERNAIYPAPAQGNLVLRPDKGYIEQYYDLYNAGTNPGGAPIAGWYPTGQRKIALPLPTPGPSISLTNNKLSLRDGWLIGSIDWTLTTGTLSHATVLMTLPVGYRPETEYSLNSIAGPAPSLAGVFLVFRPDGTISALQPPATRTSGTVHFTVPMPV